eukprot:3815339-Ditylum_brightwellii.AAC.1
MTSIPLEEKKINNMTKIDIKKILFAVIGMSEQSKTELLADIIYRKTGGNTLLVIQFFKYLWDCGLL